MYRPNTPPREDIDMFMSTISNIIVKANNENRHLILLGDFNINLLNFESHNKTNIFLDDIISNGVIPLITKPTRITDHSATLIDHINTNMTEHNITSGIVITDIADHFGTFCVIENKRSHRKATATCFQSFTESNIDKFKEVLQNADYSTIYNTTTVNDAYKNYICIFQSAYETIFPIKTKRKNKKYIKKEPWMTQGLLTSSRNKNKLYIRKINKPNEQNKNYYKKYNNLFNKLCGIAKKSYHSELIHSFSHDAKKTWSILRKIILKSKNEKTLPSTFIVNNNRITDQQAIANHFNDFFSTIGKHQSDKIEKMDTNYKRHLIQNHRKSFFMTPVTPGDVINASKHLKSKTSQGVDNISSKLVKSIIGEIASPLCHIFNLSLQSGIVPDDMKLAKVVPVFKKGDNQLFTNYRPISILPAFSKLLEKIVHKQTYNFLTSNEILNTHQYGFRKNNSTLHPILHFIKEASENNNKPSKDLTIGIFLDLSKAFDTISHDILINKLNYYGIRGTANLWFKNYLFGRTQYTYYNSFKSNISSTQYGVPQGSILGPLLFLIYINDLPTATNLNVLSYADDTTLFQSGPNIADLEKTVNIELNKIYTWLCENKLSLNLEKTNYMIFGPHNTNPIRPIIKIKNKTITFIDNSIKFLGIQMDKHFTWNNHVLGICKKVAKSLFTLNKVKKYLPSNIMLTLYYTLVHSHLNYGIIAWGNSKFITKLFQLQKKAIRITANKTYLSHTDPLFKSLSILKITDLYKLHMALFAHDYIHQKLPDSFQNFYQDPRDIILNTRYNKTNHLYTKTARTNFSKYSAYNMIASTWNNLNNELKIINKRGSFKQKLKSIILENYMNEVQCSNPNCPDCS